MKANAKHLPGFEGVRQHKQLGFGVGCSPDCRAGQPRVADLTGVWEVAAVPRMARRPRPSLQIPEARRPDGDTITHPDNRERDCTADIPPGEGGIHIACGLDRALRDRTPLVKRGIRRRCDDKAVDVTVIKRFETNMPACQHKVLCSPGSRVCDESPRGCKRSLQSHNLLPGGGVSRDRPHFVLHPVVMHLRHGRECPVRLRSTVLPQVSDTVCLRCTRFFEGTVPR